VSRSAVILRNVASNWAGFAVNAAVTLVLTPFILHELGSARYGIWILTSSIVGYYGLLDLGFRDGVTQYLTRYLAVRDYARARECMSSAVVVLGSVGVVILGLSIAAGFIAPGLLHMPPETEREAFWCILIVGISSAFQFGLQPFTSVFTATQRFDLANLVGVTTRLLTATGIVVALKSGYGLIGVSAATCGISVVDYVIRWRVAHRLAPELSVSLRHASLERVREIGAFGAWNFLIAMNAVFTQHVPNLIIGATMPIAAVGHYALAMGLTRQINSILSPVPQVLYPAAAEIHARGNKAELERLYHDGTRLMLLILVTISLLAGLWATDFYRLWVGEKFLTGTQFPSVALLFQVLLLSVAMNYSTTISSYVLMAAGRVRDVSIALLVSSLINAALAVWCARYWGLLGVTFGAVAGSIVINILTLPLLVQRALGLSVLRLAANAWGRPIVAAVLQFLLIELAQTGHRPETWLQLAGWGLLTGAGSLVIVLGVGITASERKKAMAHVSKLFRGVQASHASAA